MRGRALGASLAAALLLPLAVEAEAPEGGMPPHFTEESYSCILCHSDVKVAYARGIHQARGILCHECHGGDPSAFDVAGAKAPRTGYRGKPGARAQVELCASCHADERRMRQYGLGTDQYLQYRTSQHGILLYQKGDENVATCVDCHGSHEILAAEDPRSRVHRRAIPATCGRCHSDPVRMARYNIATDQEARFRASVHGRKLLEENDPAVPTCARCHGVHGAQAPGALEVHNVCGQCHTYIRETFLRSPHVAAERAGLMAGCIACHGSHGIEVAGPALLATTCPACHGEGSPEAQRGAEFREILDHGSDYYRRTEADLDALALRGLVVEEMRSRLQDARTLLIELRTTQHTLDGAELREDQAKATSILDDVNRNIASLATTVNMRKLLLIPIWAFLALIVLLAYLRLRGGVEEGD